MLIKRGRVILWRGKARKCSEELPAANGGSNTPSSSSPYHTFTSTPSNKDAPLSGSTSVNHADRNKTTCSSAAARQHSSRLPPGNPLPQMSTRDHPSVEPRPPPTPLATDLQPATNEGPLIELYPRGISGLDPVGWPRGYNPSGTLTDYLITR